ncbi:exonuclease domain-containing protein [Nonlabens marinus]|uniref:DNA polymerase III epsilon subunit n=1 Tax=Nonlabens marinus S1-08 TaxID=1454201 RepID=W8W0I8_9FLAO|nr:exonuclease domain-containing protein [Nonlabens marinus]BAO56401.1 DNA polymerase III epsilon subunit [Nonlabens marinus S1-08]
MYAIVDVETTGGKFNEEGITEVAIYRFDGHEVVDQFASLINPEQPIQPFVIKLTGISNAMLERAPKFYEVAKRIIEILDGTILVAHNANFDHRMLRLEFERLGYEFDMQTLCTVELAQQLMPEQESYSLGKLVRSLGIPITDRHRATGDALATVKLFKLLLNKDTSKDILNKSLKSFPKPKVAPNLKTFLEKVPTSTGLYYLYNEGDDLIFIGRSRNIKKNLTQQFTSERRRSVELTALVHDVKFEKTGSDLIAMLKENVEIKKHRPKFNKKSKKSIFSHGLYVYEDEKGYLNFQIKSARKDSGYVTSFSSSRSGRSFLDSMLKEYELCQKKSGQETEGGDSCYLYVKQECKGACINEESATAYNERAQKLIEDHNFQNANRILIDRGREVSERSVVLIENGTVKGYGYVDLQIQFTDPKILRNIITEIPEDPDYRHIVQSYLRHRKIHRIIKF